MDGSFACPECGSEVAIGGISPGRQVRCGFCHRLVEVPYLPRVAAGGWKRRRFGGWNWVRWAWGVATFVVVVALIWAGLRMARRQYRSLQDSAISEMLASSRANEAEGRLDQALVELDSALDLIRRSSDPASFSPEENREHRAELARREVGKVLDRLVDEDREVFPLGDWLNLVARSEKDGDLAPIRPRIVEAFHRSAGVRGRIELDQARRAYEAGRPSASMDACDRLAELLPYLDDGSRSTIRAAAEAQVAQLVRDRGVRLETPRGEFVLGSDESYRARLVPILERLLTAQGYLPERPSSRWKNAWKAAKYHLQLAVSEHRYGNYLSSQNRLTRIEARLTLFDGKRLVWEITPRSRSTVPLPGLPAYLSSRVAMSTERTEEFERLLYEDARGQIEGKFTQALSNMSACCP